MKTRLTRNGYHFLFIALFTIVGAVVRELNLLVILAGILFGALAIQWRFCRGSLLGLTVARSAPDEVFAGKPFSLRYHVHNPKRWLPAWLVQIDELLTNVDVRDVSERKTVALNSLGPDMRQSVNLPCVLGTRGRYRLGPLKVMTGFPFGLMNAYQYLKLREEIIVYPKLGVLRQDWQGWLMSRQAGVTVSRRRAGINEGDFYGLRSWQTGDSRRWIHWRTTARINELAVRQFEQQQRQQVALLIDLHQTADDVESFEKLIGFAATLVHEISLRSANQLAVAVGDEVLSNLHSRERAFRSQVLTALALAQPSNDSGLSASLCQLLSSCDPSWPVLVASSRPLEMQALVGREMSEAMLSRLELQWLDLSDPKSGMLFREVTNATA